VEHAAPSFVSFLLVVCLAFFAPIISHSIKKMAVPLVVVEILGGIIFGKSGFNLIKPLEILCTGGICKIQQPINKRNGILSQYGFFSLVIQTRSIH